MLFADFFGDAALFIVVLCGIVWWAISGVVKSAKDALNSDAAREAARIGLWAWFLSDNDD